MVAAIEAKRLSHHGRRREVLAETPRAALAASEDRAAQTEWARLSYGWVDFFLGLDFDPT
jgi:hypothetical protein